MIAHKRRDGFLGQRMIMLPPQLLKSAIKQNPLLSQLYISQIGYFPRLFFITEKGAMAVLIIF